ncbi:MAG: ABC transporter permease [Motiliproteus sp.]
MLTRPWLKSLRQQLITMILLLLAWQLLAQFLQNPLLPGPLEVVMAIHSEWLKGDLSLHLGATLQRVVITFTVAMLIGSMIGIIMGLYDGFNRLADPVLILLLNIPALVIILLFYLWIGLSETAAIIAVVINKVPNVVITLRQGTQNLNPDYTDLAHVYRLNAWCRFKDLLLPQLAPYFLIAARSGLALIWKIVLVVELLGRSDGVGFQLHLAFQMFDVVTILAYSLSFIIIVQLVEWTILQPLENHQQRWRRHPSTC